MIPSDTLAELATIGLSRDQAEAVARMLRAVEDATRSEGHAEIEARRANDRERKQRQRLVKSREVAGNNVKERDEKDVSSGVPNEGVYINHARADGNPCSTSLRSVEIITPLPTEGPPKGASNPKSEVLEILTECLSAQTAGELIAHRKSLRSPLTAGAARRLVKQFVETGDPEGAVSAMLVGGWKGFKSGWMQEQNARAGPSRFPEKRNPFIQAYEELVGEYSGQNIEPSSETFDGETLEFSRAANGEYQ